MVFELDSYRLAFSELNGRVLSLENMALKAAVKGNYTEARTMIAQVYGELDKYEKSPLFIPGKTKGLRERIERSEALIKDAECLNP